MYIHLVVVEGMRLYKRQGRQLISNNLLEIFQGSFGLVLCLLVEVFWDGQEVSLGFRAYPGHLQLKFLFLVVFVDEMNANCLNQTGKKKPSEGGHSHSGCFEDRFSCRKFSEFQLLQFGLRKLSALPHGSPMIPLRSVSD